MPDRDVLINAEKQKERIGAAIKDYWRDTLTRELPSVDDLMIAEELYDTLSRWGMLSALNNIKYLPSKAREYAESRPVNTAGQSEYTISNPERRITQEEVETGKCVLLPGLFDDNGIGYAYKTLAYKHPDKFVSLLHDRLDNNHWAFKYAKDYKESDITVIINKPGKPHGFSGSWVDADVILCGGMLFKTPYGDYHVDDCAIYTGSENYEGEDEAIFVVGKKGQKLKTNAFVVPGKATYPEQVVQQASAFITEDNDYTDNDEVDKEENNFRHFLNSIKNDPPARVLQNLLMAELDMSLIPNVHGKSFILKIDRKGRMAVSLAGKGAIRV